MDINDWDFKFEREKDGGPIKNWLADKAMELSVWLAVKAHPYSKVWVVTIPDDEEDVPDGLN
jgi:hypothetical protein